MATVKKLLKSAPRMRNTTPVPMGPLVKKKGPFKGSTLNKGGTVKAQNGTRKPKYSNINLMYWTDKPSAKDSADYRTGFYKGVSDIKKGLPKSKTQYNPQFGITQQRLGYAEAYENPKKKIGGKIKKARTGAWQRKEGKSPSGGLNAKGRASLRAAGHDIKAPQPQGGPRKKSFCARMSGMKKKLTSAKTANDPNSRINKSLRKWKC